MNWDYFRLLDINYDSHRHEKLSPEKLNKKAAILHVSQILCVTWRQELSPYALIKIKHMIVMQKTWNKKIHHPEH